MEKTLDELSPRKQKKFMEQVEFIPKLADKKKIQKAFKGTDFTLCNRKGLLPGMNDVACIDNHNYKLEILFDRSQTSPDLFGLIFYVFGYNFTISSGQKIIYVSSEEESQEMLCKIANLFMKVKSELGDILEQNFGSTPDWYTYN